jgi:hypothetical protein
MVEEITDEQVSLLEEKLEKLAELLTLRKIDWTHYAGARQHTFTLLSEALTKDRKSYFTFIFQKIPPKGNKVATFVINVETRRNIGGIFFNILSDSTINCNYSYDNFSEGSDFEYPKIILDRINDPNIKIVFRNLDIEIKHQKEIIELLSK